MSTLLVPTFENPFYDQITSLEGTDYLLTFQYNQREECWYLSISNAAGVLQVAGLKLVQGWPLLGGRFAGREIPPGELIVMTNDESDDSPPGLTELGEGKRCELIYFTADELP